MRFVAALCAFVASPAMAAPAYLQCIAHSDSGDLVIEVSADEATGQIMTLIPSTVYSEHKAAVFSPSEVRWSGTISFGSITYVLSRTNLTMDRTITAVKDPTTEHFTCAIQQTPKRAF